MSDAIHGDEVPQPKPIPVTKSSNAPKGLKEPEEPKENLEAEIAALGDEAFTHSKDRRKFIRTGIHPGLLPGRSD